MPTNETTASATSKGGESPPLDKTAKERVLSWVRSKNPQTMELKMGCWVLNPNAGRYMILSKDILGKEYYCAKEDAMLDVIHGIKMPAELIENHLEILGSDMGLEHLLMAMREDGCDDFSLSADGVFWWGDGSTTDYNLKENLHNQSEEFYKVISDYCCGK